MNADDIQESLDKAEQTILERLEKKFTQRWSEWVVNKVEILWLDIAIFIH